MKKKRKIKGSIFRKLLVSYFIFSFVAIITVFGGLLAEIFTLSSGDPETMIPAMLVNEDGSLDSLENVFLAKGWVEKLDENYHVVEVYGEKQTDKMSYTGQELLEMTKADIMNTDYYTFWEDGKEGSYLFIYPYDVMSVSFTFDLAEMKNSSAGTGVIVFFLVILLAEGLLVSFYIYRKIRIPLKQMVEGMKRVANGEDHVNLSFKTEGEFLEIVEAFNTMIDSLEKEKAEKEKLQQERNQMLLELSHDLKTPLASIKSASAALAEGVVYEDELGRYYRIIEAKSDRVNTMADDMFTMLKMESSDYVPEKEKVDFCELVRQICAEYYEEMSRFDVEIDIPEKNIFVMADKRLITRTVANLLTNAAKYNQTGSVICVRVMEEREQVSILVSDDGEEIAEEVKGSMFQPFVRGDKSRRTSGGTGLGLAIAKGVARKHGGDISYQYREGRNQFILTLPI